MTEPTSAGQWPDDLLTAAGQWPDDLLTAAAAISATTGPDVTVRWVAPAPALFNTVVLLAETTAGQLHLRSYPTDTLSLDGSVVPSDLLAEGVMLAAPATEIATLIDDIADFWNGVNDGRAHRIDDRAGIAVIALRYHLLWAREHAPHEFDAAKFYLAMRHRPVAVLIEVYQDAANDAHAATRR